MGRTTSYSSYASGGAVCFNSSGSISNSSFSGNSSSDKGGAVYFNSSGSISNSSFSGNSSSSSGGAVYYFSPSEGISNSISKSISNSSFSGNSASDNGGAVYFYDSDYSVINSTFVKNSSAASGGAFYGGGTILNSLFAENTAGSEANDIVSDSILTLTVDYTLMNYASGPFDYGHHNITGDPRFADAANGDYRLAADSLAIDAGDPAVPNNYTFTQDAQGNSIDLDGNPRVSGSAIDMGAYEYQ